jgi:hypothetical protein
MPKHQTSFVLYDRIFFINSLRFSSIFPWTVRPPVPAVMAQAGKAGFGFSLLSKRVHARPSASTL